MCYYWLTAGDPVDKWIHSPGSDLNRGVRVLGFGTMLRCITSDVFNEEENHGVALFGPASIVRTTI